MNQSENRKKHKTIRALENKAHKGDMNALFQLAQDYEQGQSVEKYEQAGSLCTSIRFISTSIVTFHILKTH